MNFDEDEVSAIKKKNRRADNIMLNNQGLSDDEDEDDIATAKKQSRRKSAAIYDGDDNYNAHSDKKQLLDGSDFDMKIPTAGGGHSSSALKESRGNVTEGDNDEDGTMMTTMESID